MRNLFDQYTQPENRLTHALVSVLASDSRLLRSFLKWAIGRDAARERLTVNEQALPGEPPELDEDVAERKGLPDACVANDASWALLVESKFAARPSLDQLMRHRRTALRRGLTECDVLLIAVSDPPAGGPAWLHHLRWSDVYAWLQMEGRCSQLARVAVEYLEIAEMRGSNDGYLKTGTLTRFSGIPFDADRPYSYQQAKRILGLLREQLLGDRRLERVLSADPKSPGRGAITGAGGRAVWDYIGLKAARKAGVFTQLPHLTLSIHDDYLNASVTVPNGVRTRLRRQMLGESFDDFVGLIDRVVQRISKALRGTKGAVPIVIVVQRRYPTQRSKAILDGIMRFDPRVAVARDGRSLSLPKQQNEWLEVAYELLKNRRSNLQLQIGADFPYESCPAVREASIARTIADVFLACAPLIQATTGKKEADG